eukprot:gene17968-21401_t
MEIAEKNEQFSFSSIGKLLLEDVIRGACNQNPVAKLKIEKLLAEDLSKNLSADESITLLAEGEVDKWLRSLPFELDDGDSCLNKDTTRAAKVYTDQIRVDFTVPRNSFCARLLAMLINKGGRFGNLRLQKPGKNFNNFNVFCGCCSRFRFSKKRKEDHRKTVLFNQRLNELDQRWKDPSEILKANLDKAELHLTEDQGGCSPPATDLTGCAPSEYIDAVSVQSMTSAQSGFTDTSAATSCMAFNPTLHMHQRMLERGISPEDVRRTKKHGTVYRQPDGSRLFTDEKTGGTVVTRRNHMGIKEKEAPCAKLKTVSSGVERLNVFLNRHSSNLVTLHEVAGARVVQGARDAASINLEVHGSAPAIRNAKLYVKYSGFLWGPKEQRGALDPEDTTADCDVISLTPKVAKALRVNLKLELHEVQTKHNVLVYLDRETHKLAIFGRQGKDRAEAEVAIRERIKRTFGPAYDKQLRAAQDRSLKYEFAQVVVPQPQQPSLGIDGGVSQTRGHDDDPQKESQDVRRLDKGLGAVGDSSGSSGARRQPPEVERPQEVQVAVRRAMKGLDGDGGLGNSKTVLTQQVRYHTICQRPEQCRRSASAHFDRHRRSASRIHTRGVWSSAFFKVDFPRVIANGRSFLPCESGTAITTAAASVTSISVRSAFVTSSWSELVAGVVFATVSTAIASAATTCIPSIDVIARYTAHQCCVIALTATPTARGPTITLTTARWLPWILMACWLPWILMACWLPWILMACWSARKKTLDRLPEEANPAAAAV